MTEGFYTYRVFMVIAVTQLSYAEPGARSLSQQMYFSRRTDERFQTSFKFSPTAENIAIL